MPGWRSARSGAPLPRTRLWTIVSASDGDMVSWTPPFIALLLFIFTTTSYRFSLGMPVMAVGVLGLFLQRESIRVPFPLVAFAAFLLWSYVSMTHWMFREVTFDHLTELDKVWLVALVTANALRTRRQIRLFMLVFLFTFALFPIRGALVNSVVYHEVRTAWFGVFGNPNDLAAMVLLQISMLLGLLSTERQRIVRIAAMIGLVIFPIVMFLTQSRGALLAAGTFVLLMLAKSRRRVQLVLKFALLAALVIPLAPTSVWDRLGGLSKVTTTQNFEDVDPEGSARNRYNIWRIASHIIRDHPATGVGSGAYPLAHEIYSVHDGFDVRDQGRRDTHSTYLNILAENGAPGLLLFLLVLASTVWDAERVRRRCRHVIPQSADQLALLQCGIVSFLFAGLFGSFGYMTFLYVQLMLLWCTARACERELAMALPTAPHAGRVIPHRSRRLLLPESLRWEGRS
jgi:probable O-glycosylation ligase (exosortase A-associated)